MALEDYAYVLDYLPHGRPDKRGFRRQPLVLAVGESEFKLFELVPKPNVLIVIGERVYIGKDSSKRDKIEHVKRRITYDELTHAAQSELPYILEEIVKKHEAKFVEKFNTWDWVTPRLHPLALLPGVGKKMLTAILEERKKRPFTSFEDIKSRVKGIPPPEKLIVGRIIQELQNREERRIFVAK